MSTYLMTRPEAEAQKSGLKLEKLGHRVVYAPMIKAEFVSFEMPEENRSIIITSKNGARFGLRSVENKRRPVFAVGEATAEEARSMGFTNVVEGPGTARQLVPVLMECGITEKRTYVHLCGDHVAYDIAAALRQQEVDAINTITYQTKATHMLSAGVQEELQHGTIDGVLLYSPRTATVFEETIAEIDKTEWLKTLDAFCFSDRVANCLLGPWKKISSGIMPTEKALFHLLS